MSDAGNQRQKFSHVKTSLPMGMHYMKGSIAVNPLTGLVGGEYVGLVGNLSKKRHLGGVSI